MSAEEWTLRLLTCDSNGALKVTQAAVENPARHAAFAALPALAKLATHHNNESDLGH
jgi:hypothetical protein